MKTWRLPISRWSVPLLLGAGLSLAYLFASKDSYANAALYLGAAFGATGMLLAAVIRQRLAPGWRLVAIGFVAWACGDAIWALHDIFGITAASSTLENGFYLAIYPFLTGGLVMLVMSRQGPFDSVVRAALDVALLFSSGFCAYWIFYGERVLETPHNGLSFAYPLLDLLDLALVVRFAFASSRGRTSHRLLTLSLVLLFGADLGWRLMLSSGAYVVGSWLNTLYIGAYVLAAAAALHPTASGVEAFGPSDRLRVRGVWRRLAILASASVTPGLVVYLAHGRIDATGDYLVLALTIAAIPLLGLARAADLVRTLRRVAFEADAARRRTEAILEASPIPICVMDRDSVITVWNQAAVDVIGLSAAEVIGLPAPVLSIDEEALETRAAVLHGERLDRRPVTLRRPDGELRDVRSSTAPADTETGEIVVLFEDVTHERRHRTELDELAHHDPLTGLPNRRSFEETLARMDEHRVESAWLVVLDVDGFRFVNEAAGHDLGDSVLRELAGLMRRELRRDNVLARLSGDEFAVVLRGYSQREALHLVERLLEYARDYRFQSYTDTVDVTMSAGVALFDPELTGDTALQRAADALYEAKRLGKNRLELWTSGLERHDDLRKWSPLIKDALDKGRLELFLQPIVSLRGDGPATYEGLCRMCLSENVIVGAGEFIETAEQLGLTAAIDRHMLEQAAALIEADHDIRIFVNLSPSSISSPALVRWLESRLADLPPQSLGIEITEHAALIQPKRAAIVLGRLIDAGALVAIDDFGVGFTSFQELATLPCHVVKIPGELARSAGDDGIAHAVARAVTNVAHAYGKQVVIEGIETADADARARLLGIEFGQGWHYGRPAPSRAARLAGLPVSA